MQKSLGKLARIRSRLALGAASVGLLGIATAAYAAVVTINNNTQMGGVQAHNGGMFKTANYYWWVGTELQNGNQFKSFNLYRSSDLKNWTFIKQLLNDNSPGLTTTGYGGRPKLLYNAATQKYTLWFKWGEGGVPKAAVATADTIDGTYSVQSIFFPNGNRSADLTVFQDDDNVAYLISNGDTTATHSTKIYRLNSSYTDVQSQIYEFTSWAREAPAMFKKGSNYFLMTSGRTFWNGNQQKYVTSTSLTGGWSGLTNIGGGNGYGGQTTFVQKVSGTQNTRYMWMADIWAQASGGDFNDSTYKWLPINFASASSITMDDGASINVDAAKGTISVN